MVLNDTILNVLMVTVEWMFKGWYTLKKPDYFREYRSIFSFLWIIVPVVHKLVGLPAVWDRNPITDHHNPKLA